jgi:hypothetical protein
MTTTAPRIIVETTIAAPVAAVWTAYTSPEAIKQWNAASDDWHTTAASVRLAGHPRQLPPVRGSASREALRPRRRPGRAGLTSARACRRRR